jgi:hypothetical protein
VRSRHAPIECIATPAQRDGADRQRHRATASMLAAPIGPAELLYDLDELALPL